MINTYIYYNDNMTKHSTTLLNHAEIPERISVTY